MKLTVKDIKRITEEELNKVLLKENLYRANIQKWNQKSSQQPKQWTAEAEQYFDMLEEGYYDEFLFAIHDDLPMLARIVKGSGLLPNNAERFLGSLGRSSEHGDTGNLILDFVNPHFQVLMDKFAVVYNHNKRQDDYAAAKKSSHLVNLINDNNIFSGYLGIKRARRAVHQNFSGRTGNEIQLSIDDEFTNPQESIQIIRNIWHVDESRNPIDTFKTGFGLYANEDMLFSGVNYPAYNRPQVKVSLVRKNTMTLGVMGPLPGDEDKL